MVALAKQREEREPYQTSLSPLPSFHIDTRPAPFSDWFTPHAPFLSTHSTSSLLQYSSSFIYHYLVNQSTTLKMRGEYCVYGATVLSLISAILLVFTNISQLSPGPLLSGLYMAELAVQGFGGTYDVAAGGSDGLYTGDSKAAMGKGSGLKQYYRYGVYGTSNSNASTD